MNITTHWSAPPSPSEGWTSSRPPYATSPLLLCSSLSRWRRELCRRMLLRPRCSPPSPPTGTPQLLSSRGSPPRVFPELRLQMCWSSPHHCAPWWWCRGRLPASSPPGQGQAGCRQWQSRWGSACYWGRAAEVKRRMRRMKPSHWGTDLEDRNILMLESLNRHSKYPNKIFSLMTTLTDLAL